MTRTSYILNANSNEAFLYSRKGLNGELVEIQHFECPECKMRSSELVSDSPGRAVQQSYSRTQGLADKQSPRDRVMEMFAKEIGHFIDNARKQNQFDELEVDAPPKFLGMLNKNFGKLTSKMIVNS